MSSKQKIEDSIPPQPVEQILAIKKEKRDHIENLPKQADEAARQGNLRELCRVTK